MYSVCFFLAFVDSSWIVSLTMLVSILMQAIELDSTDAILYSNRSFCVLQIGEATRALTDANTCIRMRPEWLKGYYRKGAALMSLKEYKEACDAFLAGLKLDPTNADMERIFR
ncbi:hypothetical protein HU200_045246 [Digitaria exilis]|uniref:Uncharacterized protein n=1 Tax=Digitaria exilis TaxID=1010633 RepID=A0A835EFS7_9POAL|nr:hypothetical protein HU200_045246 [Digitaria exilis]